MTDNAQPNSTTENASPELLEPISVSTPSHTSQDIPVTSALSELSLTTPAPNVSGNASPTQETPLDPKVAALLAMFPDFDTSLLQSVLESVTGDQDRAVDVLLGMSDPSYTSTQRADTTQTELDEEIARRLMLEEAEQRRPWRPQQGHDGAVPYQPRSRLAPGPDVSQQRPVEGDGVAQFQEQLGKFAETGKKTFNTLLSKVKAKMQEFDGSPRQEQPSGSGRPLPRGDSWNTPAQSQSYYDPDPPRSVEGYDVGPTAPPHTISIDQAPPPPMTQPTPNAQPAAPTSSDTTLPSNTGAPTTGAVDPSKIGLLPKRPVSLGSSSKPSRSYSEDEVEYVENPFEESTRR